MAAAVSQSHQLRVILDDRDVRARSRPGPPTVIRYDGTVQCLGGERGRLAMNRHANRADFFLAGSALPLPLLLTFGPLAAPGAMVVLLAVASCRRLEPA